MKALARVAKPGATLATWSIARGGARRACRARLRPSKDDPASAASATCWSVGLRRDGRAPPLRPPRIGYADRRAIVVGAGLAGAAVTSRLVARGWSSRSRRPRARACRRRHPGSAPACSSRIVSRDDCLLSRLTRAGFLYALSQWPASFDPQTPRPVAALRRPAARRWRRQRSARRRYRRSARLSASLCRVCDARSSRRACRSRRRSRRLVVSGSRVGAAARDRATPTLSMRSLHDCVSDGEVTTLERVGERWRACAMHPVRSSPKRPWSSSPMRSDAARLVDLGTDSLQERARPAELSAFAALRGATRRDRRRRLRAAGTRRVRRVRRHVRPRSDDRLTMDAASHAAQCRARRAHAARQHGADRCSGLDGGVGFRCVATDRMPMLGAIVDVAAARAGQRRSPALISRTCRDTPESTVRSPLLRAD